MCGTIFAAINTLPKAAAPSARCAPTRWTPLCLRKYAANFANFQPCLRRRRFPAALPAGLQAQMDAVDSELQALVRQVPQAGAGLMRYINRQITALEAQKEALCTRLSALERQAQADAPEITGYLQNWDRAHDRRQGRGRGLPDRIHPRHGDRTSNHLEDLTGKAVPCCALRRCAARSTGQSGCEELLRLQPGDRHPPAGKNLGAQTAAAGQCSGCRPLQNN